MLTRQLQCLCSIQYEPSFIKYLVLFYILTYYPIYINTTHVHIMTTPKNSTIYKRRGDVLPMLCRTVMRGLGWLTGMPFHWAGDHANVLKDQSSPPDVFYSHRASASYSSFRRTAVSRWHCSVCHREYIIHPRPCREQHQAVKHGSD